MLAAVSTSDANLSAIGPVLLSAMQKVVNDEKNVSISVFFVFTATILACLLIYDCQALSEFVTYLCYV